MGVIWLRVRAAPWGGAACAALRRKRWVVAGMGAARRSVFSNTSSLQEIVYGAMPGDFESVARLRGPDLLLPLSEMSASPVELQTLYNLGRDPAPEDLVVFAQFLRRELAIRTAQRAVELARLPHGLSEKPTIQEVCGWYAEAASKLVQSDVPDTPQKEKAFCKLLQSMLRDHTSVVRNLAIGCMEVKCDVGASEWSRIHDDIDRVLTRFYTSRIGLRFLMEQHITGKSAASRAGPHATSPLTGAQLSSAGQASRFLRHYPNSLQARRGRAQRGCRRLEPLLEVHRHCAASQGGVQDKQHHRDICLVAHPLHAHRALKELAARGRGSAWSELRRPARRHGGHRAGRGGHHDPRVGRRRRHSTLTAQQHVLFFAQYSASCPWGAHKHAYWCPARPDASDEQQHASAGGLGSGAAVEPHICSLLRRRSRHQEHGWLWN